MLCRFYACKCWYASSWKAEEKGKKEEKEDCFPIIQPPPVSRYNRLPRISSGSSPRRGSLLLALAASVFLAPLSKSMHDVFSTHFYSSMLCLYHFEITTPSWMPVITPAGLFQRFFHHVGKVNLDSMLKNILGKKRALGVKQWWFCFVVMDSDFQWVLGIYDIRSLKLSWKLLKNNLTDWAFNVDIVRRVSSFRSFKDSSSQRSQFQPREFNNTIRGFKAEN